MSRSHTHYYYTFGAATSRRITDTSNSVSCQSTSESDHIGAGKNFCIFVTKPSLTYAASKPSSYPIPPVTKVNGQLTSDEVIDKDELKVILDFKVDIETTSEEPSAKRRKLKLKNEVSKNEVTITTLKQMLLSKKILVDTGLLDETPSLYSPFYRSQTDLFMYHEQYYKQKVIKSVVASGSEDSTEDGMEGEDETTSFYTTASVCEMKNMKKKGINQLIANMIHFGVQITVKALKEGEIIDRCIVYGLGIRYDNKTARFLMMTMDFVQCKTTVEDFGSFGLVDVFNDVVSKIVAKDY